MVALRLASRANQVKVDGDIGQVALGKFGPVVPGGVRTR